MMIQDRFAGKVMVVTGGTSGIGKAVCLRAGAEGAKVVIAGRNQARGEAIDFFYPVPSKSLLFPP